MTNQKINIHNESTINAVGSLDSSRTKRVVCKTNGMVFTSVTDAAEYAGVSVPTMCGHLRGKTRTVKGMVYGYLSDVLDNPDAILNRLRETSAEVESLRADSDDAHKWREYQAKLEAERIAKERRDAQIAKEKARIERYQKEIDDANAKKAAAEERLAKLMAGITTTEDVAA